MYRENYVVTSARVYWWLYHLRPALPCWWDALLRLLIVVAAPAQVEERLRRRGRRVRLHHHLSREASHRPGYVNSLKGVLLPEMGLVVTRFEWHC